MLIGNQRNRGELHLLEGDIAVQAVTDDKLQGYQEILRRFIWVLTVYRAVP